MGGTTGNLNNLLLALAFAAVIAVVAALLLIVVGDQDWNAAVFLGLLIGAGVAALLALILRKPLPSLAEMQARPAPVVARSVVRAAAPTTPVAAPVAARVAAMAPASPAAMPGPAAAPAAPLMAAVPAAPLMAAVPAAPLMAAVPAAPLMAAVPAAPLVAAVPAAPLMAAVPAAPLVAAVPAAAAAMPVSGAAADDVAVAAAGTGTRPAGLSAPRSGKADDLKAIEGIGPVLEKLCHDMGIYHFDQIAGWGAPEVAWMNANLKGFKGRVGRDKWVAQARLIGSVGVEEFKRRATASAH